MKAILKYGVAAVALIIATQASAQVVFYENDNFEGRSFTTEQPVSDFRDQGHRGDHREGSSNRRDDRYDGRHQGFNDRASSVIVLNDRWEVCENAGFQGRCIILRPGRYPSLSAMGLNDRISSVRAVRGHSRIDDDRYAPNAIPVYDNHRRNNERLYEARITSVHAVVGTPEQRCWIEREDVAQERDAPNVPGAIIGAVIGGVLGHQVGGGRGKDVATVGGAAVGAAVGANVNREPGQRGYTQDVQHCESAARHSRPDYWDVTYDFRGREHRIQMTNPPGQSVTVNRDGEPRA